MGTRDRRIDAYIAKSARFAKPVLKHLRAVVHDACPDAEETLKWGHPAFMYKGMLCGMATFKEHCTFGFWKYKLIKTSGGVLPEQAWGQFGRITKVSELPAERVIAGYVRQAMKLNLDGVSYQRAKPKPKPPVVVPADLKSALAKNRRAQATFEGFSPSARREYVEWLGEAKQAATRARRLETAIEWIAEGKSRNWKYERRAAEG